MKRLLALLMLVGSVASAQAAVCPPVSSTAMTLPTLPQPGDVTIWQMHATHCGAFRGCWGTQLGRAMVEDGLDAAIIGVMALVDDVSRTSGACASELRQHSEGLFGFARSVFNTFERTHPYYDASDKAFSGWVRKDQASCDNYGKVQDALDAAHACLISERGKRACATSLLAKADTLFVAGLRIVNGACVELPATDLSIAPFPKPPAYPGARGNLGVLTWKCRDGKPGFDAQGNAIPCRTIDAPPRPPVDQAAFAKALDDLEYKHNVHTEMVCGHHLPDLPDSLTTLELRVQSFARTEAESMLLRTWPFPIGAHPRKAIADQCTLLRMASDDWHRVKLAILAGDQRLSERHWKAHFDDHAMLVLPPDFVNYWVTLPWDARPMEKQETITMAQAIDRYRARHPAHVEELKHLTEMH